MGWVYMDHPDVAGGAERFPDDPGVIDVAEKKGWVKVDTPEAAVPTVVEPDEVDDRGQGWVNVVHTETGGTARIPVEVVDEFGHNGYRLAREPVEKPKPKTSKKASTKSAVDNDAPPEE